METTIEHFSHRHRLKHCSDEYDRTYCCDKSYSPHSFMYTCVEETCSINYEIPYLCTACARLGEIVEHHVCKKLALNGLPVYGCQYCNFFIHQSCIQQPIVEGTIYSYPGYDSRRNDDPLALVFAHGAQFTCACCDLPCSGFIYKREDDESFVLDLQCMLLVPSLELIGHKHLVFVKHEQNTTKTSYLRCTPCREDFKITRSHCLLPNTLSHECHFHPLTLVPRLVDTDECYCDVCEGPRDRDDYIYYCAGCKFEAHIACVKSEVLGASCNKLKDVEFVNSYEIGKTEEKNKKKMQITEIFRLNEEIQYTNTLEKEFDAIFQEVAKITLKSSIGRDKGPPNKILYSDDSFEKFIQELNSTSTLEKARSSIESLKNEEVVRVGEYLVPLNCEGLLLETMSSKYRDFGQNCKYSHESKQYLFVGLCRALQNMCDTKVARVAEDMLVEWWIWCAMGNAVGFEIQFAIEIWKRVMYAHFGLEADKYADGKLTRVRKEMKELPREIEECAKKLEKARRELKEAKRKLEEAIAEEEVLREAAFRVKKSDLMNKCLKEAEDLVCYSIGEIFFPPLD